MPARSAPITRKGVLKPTKSEPTLPSSIATLASGNAATSFAFLTTSSSKSVKKKKRIKFGVVELREFPVTIGDNPYVASGCPIALDYQYYENFHHHYPMQQDEQQQGQHQQDQISEIRKTVRSGSNRKCLERSTSSSSTVSSSSSSSSSSMSSSTTAIPPDVCSTTDKNRTLSRSQSLPITPSSSSSSSQPPPKNQLLLQTPPVKIVKVQAYECYCRSRKKNNCNQRNYSLLQEYKLSEVARTERLLDAGYTVEEIATGAKVADEIRRNRDETNKRMKWDCIYYFGELTGRKFRKMSNLKKLLQSSSSSSLQTKAPSTKQTSHSLSVGVRCDVVEIGGNNNVVVDKINNCTATTTTTRSFPTRRTAKSA